MRDDPEGDGASREESGARLRLVGRASPYLALTKPSITGLVLITTAAGFVTASTAGVDVLLLLHALVGTALLSGGTNAFNQILEREHDARMPRTRDRPLPAGRLGPLEASAFAAALVVGGTLYLLAAVNGLTAFLGFLTAASYVLVYTPLKRVSSLSALVGSVPGALPILGGWTAVRGTLDPGGWVLFGVVFLWQLPHLLGLEWLCREEYREAGFRVLAAEDASGRRSSARSVAYTLALLPVSLLPLPLGLAGEAYAAVAAGLGLLYVGSATRFAVRLDEAGARGVFLVSLVYLPVLLAVLVLNGSALGGLGPAAAELAGFLSGGVLPPA